MQQAQSLTPGTLNAALALIAQQQADMARLHAAHESWMRAVAHDLRAPLRHVVSFAPLLKESVGELAAAAPQAVHAAEDAHEFASTMERAARKMSAMLDGLVHISRAARAELQPELVDWVALTVPLVQALQAQYPQVQWSLPTPAQVPVLAHAEWLRVAMQALLDNAIKFSARQESPQVQVQACPLADGWWRLVVQDYGAGFNDSRAQQLGELFQRMHHENEFDGVGCGLALVSTVAQRHGARWGVQSQPGLGGTGSLDWPGGG